MELVRFAGYGIELLEHALQLAKVHHQIKVVPVECECKVPTSHTPESGLAHYINMGYTKAQYIAFRNDLKSKCAEKVYPIYQKLAEAKKKCQIPFEFTTKNEIRFGLQNVLDTSVQRLAKVINFKGRGILKCTLDSASGYKNPNQK